MWTKSSAGSWPALSFRMKAICSIPAFSPRFSGEIPTGESLTISTGAVVPTGNKYIAFVDHGGGKLEPREIEIGAHSGDYYEVISGLNEGDRVVSGANFLIDAESRIQGVLKTWETAHETRRFA